MKTWSQKLSTASTFLLLAAAPLPLLAHKPGDRVMARQKDGAYWFAAKVESVSGDDVSVAYLDGTKETLPAARVSGTLLKVGTAVQCNFKGEGAYYNGWLTALAGDKVSVTYNDGDKENTTLGKCRVQNVVDDSDTPKWACLPKADYETLRQKHPSAKTELAAIESPYHSYGNMCIGLGKLEKSKSKLPEEIVSAFEKHVEDPAVDAMRFRKAKYKTFKPVAKLPASKLPALNKEMLAAARSAWEGSDIGDRAVVMKCAVTSGWTTLKMSDTGEISGRSLTASCAVQVAPNVCVVYHDGCRQEYLGWGKWGACQYQAYDSPAAQSIDCAKVAK